MMYHLVKDSYLFYLIVVFQYIYIYIYIYIKRDQLTQNNTAINISIPQPYFVASDNEINAYTVKIENFEIT